ncbi:hypothetical protein XELAEV_18034021mg [Xenopus laevis]|uniref:Uncharacterized protein n=1 Tax=Xenopus laevis TaxID=8355 RepID=A0A974HEI5_XENLA|nr:hypothetical protein XELAEV_18034021mg [Xenopus laevis]
MREAGLYNRFPLNAPLLKAFTNFLTRSFGVTRYKQEVENVSRFLYFMNPQDANLTFVKNLQRTEFFTRQQEIVTHQTAFSYLKHVRRFVNFEIDNTNLLSTDPLLYSACKKFIKATNAHQKRFSKGISREVVQKRYSSLSGTVKSPEEFGKLLSVSKDSFLKALDAAKKHETDDNVKFEVLNYLEALLVLKHLQRPGVVKEWKSRVHHKYISGNTQIQLSIIGVTEHKTATQQWFSKYYNYIRPRLVRQNSPTDLFFLSSTGKKLHNVSNDLWRFHRRYNLPNVSSQEVRRVCETFSVSHYSDSERHLFAKSVEAPAEDGEPPTTSLESEHNPLDHQQEEVQTEEPHTSRSFQNIEAGLSREEAFGVITKDIFPLRIDCDPPDLKLWRSLSQDHWLYLSDRWRKIQNTMRRDYAAEHFQTREHNEAQIKRFFRLKQWNVNLPRIPEILKKIASMQRTTSGQSTGEVYNYIGGVKKFISYVASDLQLLEEDPSLHGSIQSFLKSLTEKGDKSKEVLNKAHQYFVEIIDRANVKIDLEEKDMTSVLFYLEALLTLQNLQRPSVIQNMTVKQWLERTRYQNQSSGSVAAVIKVKAARQYIVVLQEAEEMWFDTLF